MTVNIVFDDALYSQAVAVAEKDTSENEILTIALQEFISKRKKLDIRDIKGKIEFAENYEYKSMRT